MGSAKPAVLCAFVGVPRTESHVFCSADSTTHLRVDPRRLFKKHVLLNHCPLAASAGVTARVWLCRVASIWSACGASRASVTCPWSDIGLFPRHRDWCSAILPKPLGDGAYRVTPGAASQLDVVWWPPAKCLRHLTALENGSRLGDVSSKAQRTTRPWAGDSPPPVPGTPLPIVNVRDTHAGFRVRSPRPPPEGVTPGGCAVAFFWALC